MGWNLGIAIAQGDDLDALEHEIAAAFGLQDEGVRTTFGEATRRDYSTHHAAVGVLDDNLLLLHHWPVDLLWENVPGSRLTLAFFASENRGGTNHFRILEYGQEVRSYHEPTPRYLEDVDDFGPRHPLEQGLHYDIDVHPFDYIDALASRVLGRSPTMIPWQLSLRHMRMGG